MDGTLILDKTGNVGTFLPSALLIFGVCAHFFPLAGVVMSIGAAVLAWRVAVADRFQRRLIIAAGERRP